MPMEEIVCVVGITRWVLSVSIWGAAHQGAHIEDVANTKPMEK
jgi:hypothetical protein